MLLKTAFRNFINRKISPYGILYGFAYPVCIGILALLFWAADLQTVFFALVSLTGGLILALKEDAFPIIPMVFSSVICVRDLNAFSSPLNYLVFIPAVIGILTHIIRFGFKNPLSFKLTVPFAVLLVGLLLGGIGSPYSELYSAGVPLALALSAVMFFIYLSFSVFFRPADGFDYKSYFCVCLLSVAVIAGLQHVLIRCGFLIGPLPEEFTLGWGNYNFMGYLALLAVPACFYLVIRLKRVIPLLIIYLLIVFLTAYIGSDGSIGTIVIFSPICVFYTFKNVCAYKRKIILLFFAVIATAILVLLLSFKESSEFVARFFAEHFLHDTGRTPIYAEAWELFVNNPIFGVGLGYAIINCPVGQNYHSVILHTLACCGVAGLLVYGYYYFERLRILTRKNTPFNVFMYMSFAMFTAYCSIDCGEYVVLMIFATVLMAVTEYADKNSVENLPLKENFKTNLARLSRSLCGFYSGRK